MILSWLVFLVFQRWVGRSSFHSFPVREMLIWHKLPAICSHSRSRLLGQLHACMIEIGVATVDNPQIQLLLFNLMNVSAMIVPSS